MDIYMYAASGYSARGRQPVLSLHSHLVAKQVTGRDRRDMTKFPIALYMWYLDAAEDLVVNGCRPGAGNRFGLLRAYFGLSSAKPTRRVT